MVETAQEITQEPTAEVALVEEVIDHKDFTTDATESVKDLLKKLKFLKAIIGRNMVVPIIENIIFSKGFMYAYDLVTANGYKTSIDGYFLVPFAKLYEVLSKIKDKETLISFSLDKEKMMLSVNLNGKKSFGFKTEYLHDFPKIPLPKKVIGTLNANDINAIARASQFTSNDELRPAMTGVYIEEGRATGTNGHMLATDKIEEGIKGEEKPFIIPPKALSIIKDFDKATIKKMDKPEYEHGVEAPKYYSFVEGERACIFRVIDERYPEYRNVLPEHSYIHIDVDRKLLMNTLDLALITANKTTKKIKFTPNENQTLSIHAEDLDFEMEFSNDIPATITRTQKEVQKTLCDEHGEVLKDEKGKHKTETVKEDVALFAFGMNGQFLLDILKSLTNETVCIEGTAANRGFYVGKNTLIMPVMLSEYV